MYRNISKCFDLFIFLCSVLPRCPVFSSVLDPMFEMPKCSTKCCDLHLSSSPSLLISDLHLTKGLPAPTNEGRHLASNQLKLKTSKLSTISHKYYKYTIVYQYTWNELVISRIKTRHSQVQGGLLLRRTSQPEIEGTFGFCWITKPLNWCSHCGHPSGTPPCTDRNNQV